MKKIYLSIMCIASLSVATAQKNESVSKKESFQTEIKTIKETTTTNAKDNASVEKAIGDTVWASDFTNPSQWLAATSGLTGVAGVNSGWNINSTVESEISKIVSTSKGNFAELYNGPFTATSKGVTHTLTTVSPIVLTSNKISLRFKQYVRLFNDSQEFEVSTDGTTWTKVGDNSNYTVNVAIPNPTNVSINLSNVISNSATTLYVRFKWTSRFPTMTEDGAWFTYGWMIDDVSIVGLADNDLTLLNAGVYPNDGNIAVYQLPLNQVVPLNFKGKIVNNGKVNQTNVSLSAAVTGGATFTATPGTVNMIVDTISFSTAAFTPTSVKTYSFSATATGLTDDISSDNVKTGSFKITDKNYAVHNGIELGDISGVTGSTSSFKIGNVMPIYATDKVESVSIKLSSAPTNVGKEFFGEIWKKNVDGMYDLVGATAAVTITVLLNNKTNKLNLATPIAVSAGDTLLVVACNNSGEDAVEFATAQRVSVGAVRVFSNGATISQPLRNPYSIMVSIDLNKTASIKEAALNVSSSKISPNPTSGATEINFTLANSSKVSVKIVDITGKTVYTSNEGDKNAGSHTISLDASTYNSGLYYVTLTTNESQITHKLVRK